MALPPPRPPSNPYTIPPRPPVVPPSPSTGPGHVEELQAPGRRGAQILSAVLHNFDRGDSPTVKREHEPWLLSRALPLLRQPQARVRLRAIDHEERVKDTYRNPPGSLEKCVWAVAAFLQRNGVGNDQLDLPTWNGVNRQGPTDPDEPPCRVEQYYDQLAGKWITHASPLCFVGPKVLVTVQVPTPRLPVRFDRFTPPGAGDGFDPTRPSLEIPFEGDFRLLGVLHASGMRLRSSSEEVVRVTAVPFNFGRHALWNEHHARLAIARLGRFDEEQVLYDPQVILFESVRRGGRYSQVQVVDQDGIMRAKLDVNVTGHPGVGGV
jgi:hypothetical protein